MSVAFRRAFEEAVEDAKKSLQYPRALFLVPQEERSKRRAQRKGVKGRQEHSDRDRHSELLVKPSCNSRNKCRRHEDRREHERDADNRTRQFGHGLARRFLGV